MNNSSEAFALWLPVIARSLARLCVHVSFSSSATIAEKANLLQSLGLDRTDIAEMLNTTPASITELMRVARSRKNKKGKGGKNDKSKRKK